jgi:DtxR family Mn-dependent transcriptional regulator
MEPEKRRDSRSFEDYIKAIYELEGSTKRVSSSALAAKLGVTPASVTGMVKKIVKDRPQILDYASHHGVKLTEEGAAIALGILRRHRLVELFLCDALGYSWDEVHEEAERLEHVISGKLEERLARFLGHPLVDPHGDPIPRKDGTVSRTSYRSLSSLEIGQSGLVKRVVSQDDKFLQYLTDLGIVLDAELRMVEKAPFGGPIHLALPGKEGVHQVRVIGKNVADQILVEPLI